ncbi:MAG TPA: nuclear transport factor 2 family protein [Vicinamibacterales bacterium]|nr:nuclear transport factor 2 family protein [Vicinamibacterales bacterium]
MRYYATLLVVFLMVPSALSAQAAEKDAVLATVNKLFDGMRTRNAPLLLSAFDESARLVRVGERNGVPAVTLLPLDRFADAVVGAKPGEVWDERLSDPEVRIDGNLAQVWSDYTFHLSGTLHHCGIDAFMLLKVGDTWKITQIADTERKDCAPGK